MLTKQSAAAAFAPLAAGGQVALCSPVAFELGYAARDADDYRALADRLSAFTAVPTTDADHRRALEVQATLAERSPQRALSLVDALVGAVADARDLDILHFDADFELVASVTGPGQAWVVPRGSAD